MLCLKKPLLLEMKGYTGGSSDGGGSGYAAASNLDTKDWGCGPESVSSWSRGVFGDGRPIDIWDAVTAGAAGCFLGETVGPDVFEVEREMGPCIEGAFGIAKLTGLELEEEEETAWGC